MSFIERAKALSDPKSLVPSINEYLLKKLLCTCLPELIAALEEAQPFVHTMKGAGLRKAIDALDQKADSGREG